MVKNYQEEKNANNMITHTANGKDYLLVKVPKEGGNFSIGNDPIIGVYLIGYHTIRRLPYPCRFLFRCSEATEEQAGQVVEKNSYGHNGFKTYTEKSGIMFWEPTARESLSSLCESIGWGMEETVVVEKV